MLAGADQAQPHALGFWLRAEARLAREKQLERKTVAGQIGAKPRDLGEARPTHLEEPVRGEARLARSGKRQRPGSAERAHGGVETDRGLQELLTGKPPLHHALRAKSAQGEGQLHRRPERTLGLQRTGEIRRQLGAGKARSLKLDREAVLQGRVGRQYGSAAEALNIDLPTEYAI